mmetsp:Transcript_65551/g.103805  ORF Transcript_65551/g.103805 Transcript_65551/m.103805 type:complete len:95 (-) Transcript_65551:927-1211(-)
MSMPINGELEISFIKYIGAKWVAFSLPSQPPLEVDYPTVSASYRQLGSCSFTESVNVSLRPRMLHLKAPFKLQLDARAPEWDFLGSMQAPNNVN